MLNDIPKTLKLNKKNFDNIQGQRFYYSPQTTWITASFLFLILLGMIYLLFTDYKLELIFIICFALILYALLEMFPKAIYKNPIFIINGNQLFYTKTEKWYDLTKCKVYTRMTKYFTTNLFINCGEWGGDNYNSLDENYWYIEYDTDLRKIIDQYYNDY